MATVLATDEQAVVPVEVPRWAALARRVLEHEGVGDDDELSLAFVDEVAMADLNRRFAGEDGPTDVLAFPMDSTDPTDDDGTHVRSEVSPLLLGDLAICPAVAARNAAAHARRYEDELALLVVHGVLHLMGMDHADAGQAEEMRRRERELLDRLHTTTAARP